MVELGEKVKARPLSDIGMFVTKAIACQAGELRKTVLPTQLETECPEIAASKAGAHTN
jgi:hypothetical protein